MVEAVKPGLTTDVPIMSIGIGEPIRAAQIDLEHINQHIADKHRDVIATLSETIIAAGSTFKPADAYPFLLQDGIRVGKHKGVSHSSSGEEKKSSRFYVFRGDFEKITSTLADLEAARRRMEELPELYMPLFELIQDTGAHISSQGAAVALRERHLEVATSRSSTQMVLKTDRPEISELLSSMDFLNPETLLDHPELYPSLGNVIKESGVPVLPGEVAELLPYFKITVRIVEDDSSKRYIVREHDRQKILEFLKGLGRELLAKPRNGS